MIIANESRLFDKVAIFGDIHYGLKNNSRKHNQDCEKFLLWFIDQAKANGCNTCIFLGDLQHHRNSVNVSTLNYLVSACKLLNEAFDDVYLLTGNHDLFYREKREIHCFPFAVNFNNIHVINDPIVIGQVALIPWLVENEHKKIKKMKSKYIFGHFELPSFLMNAMVRMPDHGGINSDDLKGADYVFSGHFHKRQNQDNIHYIGSPFPHNFSDVWDDERGMVILEWGGKPQYINWADGPKYITMNFSDLLKNPDLYLHSETHARINIDVPINYEDVLFLRESLTECYRLRELAFIHKNNMEMNDEWSSEESIEIESVDQIVFNELKAVQSEFIDSNKLLEYYLSL